MPAKTELKTAVAKASIVSVVAVLTLLLGASIAPQTQAQCAGCQHHDGQDNRLLSRQPNQPNREIQNTDLMAQGDNPDSMWHTGTDSTTLKSGTDSTTLKTGTENTMLQTGTENTMLQTGTQSALLQSGVERRAEQTNIEILVDCSQSMKEGLSGFMSGGTNEPKMEAAKRVLEQTMNTIPADVNVGLRVFGQSFNNDPFIDCQQTALLVPIGTHNRRAIVEHIRQIRPFGLTPLTYALTQAASDLQRTEGQKQIILISDGAETCGLDPCATIHELTARGINMKINIVGIGLKHDNLAKIQLNCIASQTGGKFYDSNTSAELVDNLRKITKESKSELTGKVLTKLKPAELQQVMPGNLK